MVSRRNPEGLTPEMIGAALSNMAIAAGIALPEDYAYHIDPLLRVSENFERITGHRPPAQEGTKVAAAEAAEAERESHRTWVAASAGEWGEEAGRTYMPPENLVPPKTEVAMDAFRHAMEECFGRCLEGKEGVPATEVREFNPHPWRERLNRIWGWIIASGEPLELMTAHHKFKVSRLGVSVQREGTWQLSSIDTLVGELEHSPGARKVIEDFRQHLEPVQPRPALPPTTPAVAPAAKPAPKRARPVKPVPKPLPPLTPAELHAEVLKRGPPPVEVDPHAARFIYDRLMDLQECCKKAHAICTLKTRDEKGVMRSFQVGARGFLETTADVNVPFPMGQLAHLLAISPKEGSAIIEQAIKICPPPAPRGPPPVIAVAPGTLKKRRPEEETEGARLQRELERDFPEVGGLARTARGHPLARQKRERAAPAERPSLIAGIAPAEFASLSAPEIRERLWGIKAQGAKPAAISVVRRGMEAAGQRAEETVRMLEQLKVPEPLPELQKAPYPLDIIGTIESECAQGKDAVKCREFLQRLPEDILRKYAEAKKIPLAAYQTPDSIAVAVMSAMPIWKALDPWAHLRK
jgi:hypothetical protein